jgi:hypothetical protein
MTIPLTPDFRALLEKGFTAIDAAEENSWHKTTFDESGIPYVHCSNIGGCPRAYVLQAIGEATDGNTVDSSINFTFGHAVHKAFEDTMGLIKEFDGWRAEFIETGGVHSKMPLTGKPDALLISPSGQRIMCDWKSEAGSGKIMREKNAKFEHATDNVRHEHKLQVTGGCLLYEDSGLVAEKITTGMVVYLSRQVGKNRWDFSTELFEITDALRDEVQRLVAHKAKMWLRYKETGLLPVMLAPVMQYGRLQTPWNCKAREPNDGDQRGLYCSARFACKVKHATE